MMMLFVLLMLSVCCCTQADDHNCSVEDIAEMQAMFGTISNAGQREHRVLLSYSAVQRLLRADPHYTKVFGKPRAMEDMSVGYRSTLHRIQSAIIASVYLLSSPGVLDSYLEHISNRHRRIPGLKYEAVHYFVLTYGQTLNQMVTCFNPEAWRRCGTRIAAGAFKGVPE